MSLIPVDEALRRVLASVDGPTDRETVPLLQAAGRVLASPLAALRTQPPFAASAMDGYAVRAADLARPPATLRVVGVSAAGHAFRGTVGPGEAVRIFTGAPLPAGADCVALQENAEELEGGVRFADPVRPGRFVRARGLDFEAGQALLQVGAALDPRRLALAAAMGHAVLPVRRRPRVAVLATGDELVPPGSPARDDQIVASNTYALCAMLESWGAEALDLGIAADDLASLEAGILASRDQGADVLLTLGGASVGEHDLLQSALGRAGLALGFWRVALRPGKPLLHGRLAHMQVLGLPGNPVSSIVCGLLFARPLVRALLGDPSAGVDRSEGAILADPLAANDDRQDYLRARIMGYRDDRPLVAAEAVQDSSMLSVLARSDALIVRAPRAPAAAAGEVCRILRLD